MVRTLRIGGQLFFIPCGRFF